MKKLSFSQQACIKKAGLALQKAAPLWPGCRIGVAVSGGVDSFTMLKVLKIRQGILPFKVELVCLHLNPGFNPQEHGILSEWLRNEGIASHLELTDFGIVAHSDQNRKKSPCFLCAWARRKRLFQLCRQYQLTHLAIGHNADDLLDTFALNFFRNGRLQGLAIGEKFFDGRLTMIRPLALVEKRQIRQAARQWRMPVWKNSCPSAGKTGRTQMAELLARLDQELPGARKSALNGLLRWQLARENCKGNEF